MEMSNNIKLDSSLKVVYKKMVSIIEIFFSVLKKDLLRIIMVPMIYYDLVLYLIDVKIFFF